METQYDHSESGLELQGQDVNSVSLNAAVGDDRLLWEFLRLQPGSATPQKAVVPYGISGGTLQSGLLTNALVWGGSADAKIHVNPFRGVVGSRTTLATDPLTHLRDVRSGYLIGSTTLESTVTISPNASGDPRWTLIYATIAPDADGDSDARKKRDPITGGDSTPTVVINKKTTVVLQQLDGTPAASPTRPAIPADAAGLYHVPLAYIYVPDGTGATTVIERGWIMEVAPVLGLHSALGMRLFAPADQQYAPDGTVDANQDGATSATRPGSYLPSTMVGGTERLILIDLQGTPANSHEDGDVVDASTDWRYRYFHAYIHTRAGSASTVFFASDRAATGAFPCHSGVQSTVGGTFGVTECWVVGQSFVDDTGSGATFTPSVSDGLGAAAYWNGEQLTSMNPGGPDAANALMIYVRDSDGALIFKQTGTTPGRFIVWLKATAQYHNYGAY